MVKSKKGNQNASLAAPLGASPTVADMDTDAEDETPSKPGKGARGGSGPSGSSGGVPSGPSGPRGPLVASGAGGFFHIYKKGQGYWTRMGTAGGAVLVGALTTKFLFDERQTVHLSDTDGDILCLVFIIAYSLTAYMFMNRPRSVDFLIATDSEMKKVNWTTKEELMGSTKVVILFMFLMAAFLFLMDVFFGYLFYWFGVLKSPPM